jgi:uncharacterized membrane protein
MPEQIEQMRIRYGLLIILAGFVLVALVSVVAIFRWDDATNTSAVIGATTSLVGTVVGAFLGVQVGSAGKERAEAARERSEEAARAAMAMLPPDSASQLQADLRRQGTASA